MYLIRRYLRKEYTHIDELSPVIHLCYIGTQATLDIIVPQNKELQKNVCQTRHILPYQSHHRIVDDAASCHQTIPEGQQQTLLVTMIK